MTLEENQSQTSKEPLKNRDESFSSAEDTPGEVYQERMQILEMIERNEITPEEGLRRIQALNDIEFLEDITADQTLNAEGDTESMMYTLPAQSETIQPDIGTNSLDNSGQTETLPPQRIQITQDEPGKTRSNLGEVVEQASEEAEIIGTHQKAALPPDADRWRRWWQIPLWIGSFICVLGGLLMYVALQSSGMGFWFICNSLVFALGVIVIIVAVQSRTSRWLHLRVQQKPGEKPQRIAISFPLPLRFTAWIMRNFGHLIPNLGGTSLDEIILAMQETTSPDNPVYIQVDEGEDGERVEIFIG